MTRLCIAVAASLWTSLAFGFTPSVVWNGQQFVAAHSASSPAIVLPYKVETIGSKQPGTVSGSATLASDFLYVAGGDSNTLSDFRSCRVLSWKSAAQFFRNDSCYAMPRSSRWSMPQARHEIHCIGHRKGR